MIVKVLLYIVVGYFVIRAIQRVFEVRSAVGEMRQRMEDFAQQGGYEEKDSQDGEIRIKSKSSSNKKKSGGEDGDYVDFEEID